MDFNEWLKNFIDFLYGISPKLADGFIQLFEYVGRKYDLWYPVDETSEDDGWGADHIIK